MNISADAGLFGTQTRTNILLVLSLIGETHASELGRIMGGNVSNIVKAVNSLEQTGVIASVMAGRTRRVKLNPRYPYRGELIPLLEKMALSSPGILKAVSDLRRRPRRSGKEV